MNEEEQTPAEEQPPTGEQPSAEEQLSQEEVRQRLEEQIRKLRVEDLMVESIVSLLNLTARRIAKEDERDLEQGRIGIEAIRAWVDLLPEEAANQIRNALSELQLLYANATEGESGGGPEKPEGGGAKAGEDAPAEQPPPQPRRGEPPPPRLWTPGSN